MSNLFVGTGNSLQPVQSVGLDEESLRDVAMRIKLQPNFLGERLVVIAEEADFPQVLHSPDTHHLVALDVQGRPVVVEVRLGVAKSETPFYALRHAAYLSRLSAEELGKVAHAFVNRPANLAISRSWQEAGVEMSDESVELSSLLATAFERDADDFSDMVNRSQRIIVAAEAFDSRMVEMIDWLAAGGSDVRGLQFSKFMVGGQEIYFAQQVVPKLDPAVDASASTVRAAAAEVDEPWRTRGLPYYQDRVIPSVANQLDQIVRMLRPHTFSIDWMHKYYFLVRGARRNLRLRVYHRNRIDIGFLNATVEGVNEFFKPYGLERFEAVMIGGYEKSPFVSTTSDMELDDRWRHALSDWLSGEDVFKSRKAVPAE